MKAIKLVIPALMLSCLSFGQLPPKEAYPLDVKQIHSGHSLTDPLFGQPWPGQYVNLITDLRGTWAGDDIGKSTIPGSPMFWRWDNEVTELTAPFSARHNIDQWELLVITEGIPIPDDGGSTPLITPANEALLQYVNNAWNNGNAGNGAPTLLWTTWTHIDNSEGIGPFRATLDTYELLWEEMQDYANANRPAGATPVYLIPGHRMMARLYDDIALNNVPDVSGIEDFFEDAIHVNSLGAYAVAMIHYACIYNESPVGLSHNLMPGITGFEAPTPALALYLQTMIWDIVTDYDRTGITEEEPNTIFERETSSKTIKVYPNPICDKIVFQAADPVQGIVLYNITGNKIQTVKCNGKAVELNLLELAPGMYFAEIQTVKGRETVKFVKE